MFVCLIASLTADGVMHTKICRASNLTRNLARHNRETKCADKETRVGAPHWRYVLVIGPMKKGHSSLAQQWRESGNTLQELTTAGMKLGRKLSAGMGKCAVYYGV